MTTSACLVTASPSLEERKQTAPFLLAETAFPDPRLLLVLKNGSSQKFRVSVVSEDAGEQVHGQLVLDYGYPGTGGLTPFRQTVGLYKTLEPGTLDDGPRNLDSDWPVETSTGCHNVAFFASHEFDNDTGCATDPADFDYVLWTVFVCNAMDGSCCDPDLPPDEGGCSISCPQFDTDVRCGSTPSTGDSP